MQKCARACQLEQQLDGGAGRVRLYAVGVAWRMAVHRCGPGKPVSHMCEVNEMRLGPGQSIDTSVHRILVSVCYARTCKGKGLGWDDLKLFRFLLLEKLCLWARAHFALSTSQNMGVIKWRLCQHQRLV